MSLVSRLNMAVARRSGFVVRRHDPASPLDLELRLFVKTYQLSTIVDVGAHVGGFALRQRSRGFQGRIISIEPFTQSYERLARSANGDPKWDTHNVALGRLEESALFHEYAGDGQLNSFRELSDHATSYREHFRQVSSFEVAVRRLDSLWPSLGADASRSLLKIDTQGYDLEVLDGSGDVLADFPVVLTEVAVKPLYEGAPQLEEVVAAMRSYGFEMTGAFPIHRYDGGVRVIEFDCTFCNVRVSGRH